MLNDPAAYVRYCNHRNRDQWPAPAILPTPNCSSAGNTETDVHTTSGASQTLSLSPVHLEVSLGTQFSYVSSVGSKSGAEIMPRILEGPWKPALISSPRPRDKEPARLRSIFSAHCSMTHIVASLVTLTIFDLIF